MIENGWDVLTSDLVDGRKGKREDNPSTIRRQI